MAYKYFNPNPSNLSVGDCVIRAIAKLTNYNWQDTYDRGYSGDSKEEMIEKLKDMMMKADKPEMKQAIQNCIATMEK